MKKWPSVVCSVVLFCLTKGSKTLKDTTYMMVQQVIWEAETREYFALLENHQLSKLVLLYSSPKVLMLFKLIVYHFVSL